MVDDGLQFAVEESSDQNKKLNRKTVFVGNGTQITDLTPTTEGMLVYPTNTTGSYPNEFQIDRLYSRLAGNTTWSRKLQESSEGSLENTKSATSFVLNNRRYYNYHTLPTTEKFYIITALEWHNNVVSGGASAIAGVDIIDTIPPTLAHTPLVALAQERVQTGSGALQKVPIMFSNVMRGGTLLGAWIEINASVNASIRRVDVSAQKSYKSITYSATPDYGDNTAWVSGVEQAWVKIYYRGYV